MCVGDCGIVESTEHTAGLLGSLAAAYLCFTFSALSFNFFVRDSTRRVSFCRSAQGKAKEW